MNDRNKYFAAVFTRELNRWKAENKLYQADFSRNTGIHTNSLSRYRKGEAFPTPPALEAICKELGVDESIFYPQTLNDKLKYDEGFRYQAAEWLVDEELKAIQSLGISLQFYGMLRNIPNFKEIFPFATTPKDTFEETCHGIPSSDHFHGFTMSNGKKAVITKADLSYIKQLEEEVTSFIEYQFYKKKQVKEKTK